MKDEVIYMKIDKDSKEKLKKVALRKNTDLSKLLMHEIKKIIKNEH